MNKPEMPYDVAISFLSQDDRTANDLHDRLEGEFSVFVYSHRQEEIAGTDGLESFRQAFRSQSRLVVILYRNSWGQTRWTRVEETAIKDRFLDEGCDWLLLVSLDSDSTLPPWFPDSRIWLNFEEFGIDQLVGAIRYRIQDLGGTRRVETPAQMAARIARESQQREERERLLENEGFRAAQKTLLNLFQQVVRTAKEMATAATQLNIEAGHDSKRECVVSTRRASVSLIAQVTLMEGGSSLTIREWAGRVPQPGKQRNSRLYRHLRDRDFSFDYLHALGWCWKSKDRTEQSFTNEQVTDRVVSILMDLHRRVDSGNIPLPTDND